MRANSKRRHHRLLICVSIGVSLILVACSGPDEFGQALATPTATVTATPVATATPEPEPTPTEEPTSTSEPTVEPTPTEEAEPTPTETVEPTEEIEPTQAPTAAPQPTMEAPAAQDALPSLEEVGEGGYILVDQGDRTAEQLAQAYIDSAAHLQRLEEWGFQRHVYREFTRNESDAENQPPRYILATVNVYGSPEQADLALQWLERFQTNQGASVVEAPDVGDAAVALTVHTAQGEETAAIYVRHGNRVYIYYGQGSNPMPKVQDIARRTFERLQNGDQSARNDWPFDV